MSRPSAEPEARAPQVAPTLSVTLLDYNYGRYLPEAIESILEQTFTDFELIVIDDCSTDNSIEVIRPYLGDPRVRLVAHATNAGYGASLIEGTEVHSRGAFVTVISADDVVRSREAFARQLAMLAAHPRAAFCFSGYDKFVSETGVVVEEHHSYAGDRVMTGETFMRAYLTQQHVQVLHSGTVLRKSAYDRAGGYRRDLRMALDFALWPVLALEGDVAYCDGDLYAYRAHSGQMSTSLRRERENFEEVVKSVEGALEAAERHAVSLGPFRGQALRYSLFAVAIDNAFSGRWRLALARCLSAVLFRPTTALRSRGLWITLARVALGQRGWQRLTDLLRLLR